MAATNPFPGMNPFLEQWWWGDARAGLTVYTADELQYRLPTDLRARVGERRFLEPVRPHARGNDDVAEVAEPFIKVIDTSASAGGRVVTLIQFLSHANKSPGPGRDLYLAQTLDAHKSGVSVVEIDLVRGGLPVLPEKLLPLVTRTTYHVSVRRAGRSDQVDWYAISLRQRLPKIPIPLRPMDGDVVLDLQEMIDLCHRRGRYDDIDYSRPLDPSLGWDDVAWVDSLLKAAGLR